MKPLAIGDRVRVFCHLGSYKGTVVTVGLTVNNRYRKATGLIEVKGDNGETWAQHPRQCRRLRSKPKKEAVKGREERWIVVASFQGLGGVIVEHVFPSYAQASGRGANPLCAPRRYVACDEGETICPAGSVPVSREMLVNAWDQNVYANGSNICKSNESKAFRDFCAALGFDSEGK